MNQLLLKMKRCQWHRGRYVQLTEWIKSNTMSQLMFSPEKESKQTEWEIMLEVNILLMSLVFYTDAVKHQGEASNQKLALPSLLHHFPRQCSNLLYLLHLKIPAPAWYFPQQPLYIHLLPSFLLKMLYFICAQWCDITHTLYCISADTTEHLANVFCLSHKWINTLYCTLTSTKYCSCFQQRTVDHSKSKGIKCNTRDTHVSQMHLLV